MPEAGADVSCLAEQQLRKRNAIRARNCPDRIFMGVAACQQRNDFHCDFATVLSNKCDKPMLQLQGCIHGYSRTNVSELSLVLTRALLVFVLMRARPLVSTAATGRSALCGERFEQCGRLCRAATERLPEKQRSDEHQAQQDPRHENGSSW